MLKLKIARVTEDRLSAPLRLPLSLTDYVNQKNGRARAERTCGMLLLNEALEENGVHVYELDLLPSGKPVLMGCGMHFNLSHAGGLCAVALSDAPVGIDLQNLSAFDSVRDLDKFAYRFLAPDEYRVFLEEPTAERLCRLWTRKEALVKLLGRSLGSSLSSLSSLSFEGVGFEHRRAELDGDLFLLTVARFKDNNHQIESNI